MSERFKPITAGLGPLFADLERRVQSVVELADKVRAALPGEEKEHVISASYRDSTLVVIADSAAWCAQIRYAQERLREQLTAQGETPFTKLKVRVGRR